jgi:bifunctional NMN adenylyltransferase/nudix hydrolase
MIYDYAIVIGRFQPVHIGHKALIDEARRRAKQTIVIVGSHSEERTKRNPWLIPERRKMLRLLYPDSRTVAIGSAADFPGQNEAWARSVMCQASRYMELDAANRILMLTSAKEDSDWIRDLRNLFFEWTVEAHESPFPKIHATNIRDRYFNFGLFGLNKSVPCEIYAYLTQFYDTSYFWKAADAYHDDDIAEVA